MIKRNWLLVLVALVLAGVYAACFTDWFTPKIIHITSTNARTTRAILRAKNSAAQSATIPIFFKLGRPCKLTELKVVELDKWNADHNCLPLWHLVAGTNSAPISEPFLYGDFTPGSGMRSDYYIQTMKPAVPGARAQPLQPGVKYRLLITDGDAKGEIDFQPLARPSSQ